jgi:uncharacterized protein (DUF1015 family)
MSELKPFGALRFARDAERKLAGPYDVIAPEERERLAAEPENVVHLTLPPGPEGARDYDSAAATLERWRRDGVLVRDPERLYVLEERTTDGRVRRGFLGLLRLRDLDEGVVLPHENTMPGPKRDRLLLTRAVRANLEPLFFTYEDRDAKLDALLDQAGETEPLLNAVGPDGTELALYALDAPEAIGAVQAFLADLPVIIADGHHRYETMITYRDERRASSAADPAAGHEFVLAYLVNAYDPGTEIRAIHRLLRGATSDVEGVLKSAGFALQSLPWPESGAALVAELAERAPRERALAFARADGLLLATRKRGDRLDVEILHDELLGPLGGELEFDARPDRLLEVTRRGPDALGIFLNPIAPEDLFRVIQAGARLPKKSTFFTPKIPSGLVVRDGL